MTHLRLNKVAACTPIKLPVIQSTPKSQVLVGRRSGIPLKAVTVDEVSFESSQVGLHVPN